MIKIVYPDKKPNIRRQQTVDEVFCLIRKKWLKLTPEEWVRQNILLYLTEVLQYPASLIAVEKEIVIGALNRRFDILVYQQSMQPYLIVECKEMNIPLTADVLRQALHYYSELQTEYLIISNGKDTIGYKKSGDSLLDLEEIPVNKK